MLRLIASFWILKASSKMHVALQRWPNSKGTNGILILVKCEGIFPSSLFFWIQDELRVFFLISFYSLFPFTNMWVSCRVIYEKKGHIAVLPTQKPW